MGSGVDIPLIGGQNTMVRRVNIPWVGVDILWIGVNMPSVGVRYTIGRVVKIS